MMTVIDFFREDQQGLAVIIEVEIQVISRLNFQ
jgi:hypothetical protein